MEKRGKLSLAEEACKNEKIFQKIIACQAFAAAKCIYTYVSFQQEVSTRKLISHAWSVGKAVAVPRVEGRNMEFYYIKRREDLEPGCKNILEPKNHCKAAQEEKVLVILPGLAFDKTGHRIGYGGGYYDRYLAGRTDVYKLGIAFDFQIYDQLPAEAFDCPADQVISNEEEFLWDRKH